MKIAQLLEYAKRSHTFFKSCKYDTRQKNWSRIDELDHFVDREEIFDGWHRPNFLSLPYLQFFSKKVKVFLCAYFKGLIIFATLYNIIP